MRYCLNSPIIFDTSHPASIRLLYPRYPSATPATPATPATHIHSMAVDFRARALAWIDIIVNKRNTKEGAAFLHPSVQLIHDDAQLTKRAFEELWPQVLAQSPDFHLHVKDTLAEGRRVWIFSEASGRLGGGLVDDVHMLLFDDAGLIIRSHGIQRPKESKA